MILGVLCACDNSMNAAKELVEEWQMREVEFPVDCDFVTLEGDVSNFQNTSRNYAVLYYADSTECLNCRLNLLDWKLFMEEIGDSVPVFFYFNTSDIQSVRYKMRLDNFNYPVCWRQANQLNELNNFPSDIAFQTFLLDKDNKVLAIGNPVLNPKVKELYLRIIQGKPLGNDADAETPQTTVSVSSTEVSLDGFPWQEPQSATLTLTNTGTRPLVIQDVVTSCGCLTVDYPREPVRPGGEAALRLTYKADNPGYFRKTVTVYANAEEAPLKVQVSGNAE